MQQKFKRLFLTGLLMVLAITMYGCTSSSDDAVSDASGTLKVNLVLYGPVNNSEELRSGLESAVGDWTQIYSRAGITLDVKWYDFEGDDTLPDPRKGSSVYSTITNATRKNAVNVVLASKISGLAGDDQFGVSGAVPGSLTPGPNSVVAVSLLQITGNDGRLDTADSNGSNPNHTGQLYSDEVRLAAEVMAQETAQYLGLAHIVTFGGTRVVSTDSLSDTASCLTQEDCRLNSDARSNFMMPRILKKYKEEGEANLSNEYYARDQVTVQQAVVLNTNPLLH